MPGKKILYWRLHSAILLLSYGGRSPVEEVRWKSEDNVERGPCDHLSLAQLCCSHHDGLQARPFLPLNDGWCVQSAGRNI